VKNQPLQEAQFLEVLESHKKLVFKIANTYCQDKEDRKDLIQEIVLQLWKSFPKYDALYAISTWIYRIALNVSISFLRKEKTRRNVSLSNGNAILEMTAEEETETLKPEIRLLQHFISRLNQLDKALMILYLEEKSHEEISQILGISKSNVGTRIGRIKQKLKENFNSIKE
jgi:RNA polymerase sigma-70 factor (ECF subfamily)